MEYICKLRTKSNKDVDEPLSIIISKADDISSVAFYAKDGKIWLSQ